jgi:hypothetical protein
MVPKGESPGPNRKPAGRLRSSEIAAERWRASRRLVRILPAERLLDGVALVNREGRERHLKLSRRATIGVGILREPLPVEERRIPVRTGFRTRGLPEPVKLRTIEARGSGLVNLETRRDRI